MRPAGPLDPRFPQQGEVHGLLLRPGGLLQYAPQTGLGRAGPLPKPVRGGSTPQIRPGSAPNHLAHPSAMFRLRARLDAAQGDRDGSPGRQLRLPWERCRRLTSGPWPEVGEPNCPDWPNMLPTLQASGWIWAWVRVNDDDDRFRGSSTPLIAAAHRAMHVLSPPRTVGSPETAVQHQLSRRQRKLDTLGERVIYLTATSPLSDFSSPPSIR